MKEAFLSVDESRRRESTGVLFHSKRKNYPFEEINRLVHTRVPYSIEDIRDESKKNKLVDGTANRFSDNDGNN